MAGTLGATGLVALNTMTANAAPPAFPDNIIVFPNRDFVSVQGYQNHIGETATLELTRAGVGVVGSAQATVAEGDVAFEVNHLGGVCWGAGTGLKVTPDIVAGDVVTIKFAGQSAGDTTVTDAAVTGVQYTPGSTTLKVVGNLGAGVNQDQLEQRIVNPDLLTTTVNRRDIRAVPGPLTVAPRGGYSSALEFTGQTFTGRYEFDDAATAAKAATGGGDRIMGWQFQDVDGNRQGLTISEFGELGGPGFGGCPNGPLGSGPVGPTNVAATAVSGGIKVNWTPAVGLPGTPPITGYRVTAVSQTVSAAEQNEIGKRISDPAAKSTTLTGLSASDTYVVQIVSTSITGETFPAISVDPQSDFVAPTVTASPAGGSYAVGQLVKLTSSEPNTDIYYTTDPNLSLFEGDAVSPAAIHYSGAINVSATSTLRWVAFDPAANQSSDSATYTITNTPVPDAPVLATPVLGAGTASISWTDDPSVTEYVVQAYDANNAPFGTAKTVADPPVLISGLVAGDKYTVGVKATNANGTGPEAKTATFTAIGAVVANAGPDQTVRRSTTVTLDASGSTQGAGITYTWTQVLTGASDPDKVTLTGATTQRPTFSYPLFAYPMTNGPLTFKLTVSDGTVSKSDTVVVNAAADTVTIGTAKWKSGDFRVTGTSTTVGATVTVRSANNPALVLGTAPVTAAVAPATGGVYSVRVRTGGAAVTNPGRIFVDSSQGGTAGPFTVTLG